MSHMPAPPARNWSGWLFAAALMVLVIASFATLSLKLGDLASKAWADQKKKNKHVTKGDAEYETAAERAAEGKAQ